MIYLLVCFSICEYIQFTNENFIELSRNKSIKSMFIDFWDPWCQHCKNFRPIWTDFAEEYHKKHPSVIFGDTDCVANKELCKNLSITNYPRVAWIDVQHNKSILYDGALDKNGLEFFLNKQLNFPIIILDSDQNIKDYVMLANVSSVFIMGIPKLDDPAFTAFRQMAITHRESKAVFLSILSNKFFLKAYLFHDISIEFSEIPTYPKIENFIQSNLHPIVQPLSNDLVDVLDKKREMFIIIFINESYQLNSFVHIVNNMSTKYVFAHQKYNGNEYYCRYIRINPKNLPRIVYFDPAHGRWSFYEGKLNYIGVNAWIDSFDINKANWKGPKNNEAWEILYHVYAEGGNALMIIEISVLLTLLVILFIALDIYHDYQKECEKDKKKI